MKNVEIACGGISYSQLMEALAAPIAEQFELV